MFRGRGQAFALIFARAFQKRPQGVRGKTPLIIRPAGHFYETNGETRAIFVDRIARLQYKYNVWNIVGHTVVTAWKEKNSG